MFSYHISHSHSLSFPPPHSSSIMIIFLPLTLFVSIMMKKILKEFLYQTRDQSKNLTQEFSPPNPHYERNEPAIN